jgi:hypothetical protein
MPVKHSPYRHLLMLVLASLLAAACSSGRLPGSTPTHQPAQTAPTQSVAGEPHRGSGDCHPPPDAGKAHYIVGYGSLMQDESRKRTSPKAGTAYPVIVDGYRRGWFSRGQGLGFSATYLGVVEDRSHRMNAVIYRVDPTEVVATDQRESSYCRRAVDPVQVTPVAADAPPPEGQFWLYVTKEQAAAPPSGRYPIVQSYVDIFVAGCLEQESRFAIAGFAKQCLLTTTDWSGHWVNDRIFPRRPFAYQPKAGEIDRLLAEQLPEYFSQIRLESGQ